MKQLLLVALIIAAVSSAFAQTPNTSTGECKLTLAQAPAIRGIRLGMSADQVLAQRPEAGVHLGRNGAGVGPGHRVAGPGCGEGVDPLAPGHGVAVAKGVAIADDRSKAVEETIVERRRASRRGATSSQRSQRRPSATGRCA